MVFKAIENGWLVEKYVLWVSRFNVEETIGKLLKLGSVTLDDSFLLMQAEVDFLGQLHHPNLVKLIGYCIEDDQRLLVYEFMTRGSLENHLFRSESHCFLSFQLKCHFFYLQFGVLS